MKNACSGSFAVYIVYYVYVIAVEEQWNKIDVAC